MGKEVSRSARMQLFSPGGPAPTLLWQDVGGIQVAPGALWISGRLVIVETGGAGVFQAEVGLQTFTSDLEVAAAPAPPATNLVGTPALGFKFGVSKNFFSFDPTLSTNADLTKFLRFRLGVLYNTQTAAFSRAEVLFEYTVRYA